MTDLTDAWACKPDFDAILAVEETAKRITDVYLAPLVRRLDPHKDRADFMAVHNAVGSCVSLMTAAALLRDERAALLDHIATLTAERDQLKELVRKQDDNIAFLLSDAASERAQLTARLEEVSKVENTRRRDTRREL